MDRISFDNISFLRSEGTRTIEIKTPGGNADVEYDELIRAYFSTEDETETLRISGTDGSVLHVSFDSLKCFLFEDIADELSDKIRKMHPEHLISMAADLREIIEFEDDDEILEIYGWELSSVEPREVKNKDTGDTCSGLGIHYLIEALRAQRFAENKTGHAHE